MNYPKIKISKTFILKHSKVYLNFWEELFNELDGNLRNLPSLEHIHSVPVMARSRSRKTPFYIEIISESNRTVKQYLKNNMEFLNLIDIRARNHEYIPVTFKSADVVEMPFDKPTSFSLLFESDDFYLVRNLGDILILADINNPLRIITLDMNETSLSISSFVES